MSECTFFWNTYETAKIPCYHGVHNPLRGIDKLRNKFSGKIKEVREIVVLVDGRVDALRAISNMIEKKDCTEKMTFEKRHEVYEWTIHIDIWGKSVPDKGYCSIKSLRWCATNVEKDGKNWNSYTVFVENKC